MILIREEPSQGVETLSWLKAPPPEALVGLTDTPPLKERKRWRIFMYKKDSGEANEEAQPDKNNQR